MIEAQRGRWVKYKKTGRRKCAVGAQEAHQRTAAPDAASQYNPHFFGTGPTVQELEMKCVEKGMLISESVHRRTYYMKVDEIVGVCRGRRRISFSEQEDFWKRSWPAYFQGSPGEMGVVV